MIPAYIPDLYPDELFFSWICRINDHSAYPGYRATLQVLLGQSKYIRVDLTTPTSTDFRQIIDKMCPMDEIIFQHTLFPAYARFRTLEYRQQAYDVLYAGEEDVGNSLMYPDGNRKFLRYCPMCAGWDRERYGETYWHRLHQLPDLDACPVHGCTLITTNVSIIRKIAPKTVSAEEVIRKDSEDKVQKVSPEYLDFARYYQEIFLAPMDMKSDYNAGKFLAGFIKEKTGYSTKRGGQTMSLQISCDMKDFYRDLGDSYEIKSYRVANVITGKSHDMRDIARVAYFLGIPAEELLDTTKRVESKKEVFDAEVHRLYTQGYSQREIARKMDAPRSLIRTSLMSDSTVVQDYAKAKNQKKHTLQKKDAEMVGQVKGICESLQYRADGRPQRVALYPICAVLGIQPKNLRFYPQCEKTVMASVEPWEEYWARALVWAYKEIKKEGEPFFRERVREKTGIVKKTGIRALPVLYKYAGPEVEKKIREAFLR